MPRFLIEVPHEAEPVACARAIKVLLESGSHFLTHADFGCRDGIHKGWIMLEADSKAEARTMLHPVFRSLATIIELNKFSVEELDELITHHGEKRPANRTNLLQARPQIGMAKAG
jgi:hypothetical protein